METGSKLCNSFKHTFVNVVSSYVLSYKFVKITKLYIFRVFKWIQTHNCLCEHVSGKCTLTSTCLCYLAFLNQHNYFKSNKINTRYYQTRLSILRHSHLHAQYGCMSTLSNTCTFNVYLKCYVFTCIKLWTWPGNNTYYILHNTFLKIRTQLLNKKQKVYKWLLFI